MKINNLIISIFLALVSAYTFVKIFSFENYNFITPEYIKYTIYLIPLVPYFFFIKSPFSIIVNSDLSLYLSFLFIQILYCYINMIGFSFLLEKLKLSKKFNLILKILTITGLTTVLIFISMVNI